MGFASGKLYGFKWMIPIRKSETLTDVYASLDDKGYNPINQVVGCASGDPPTFSL